MKIASIIGENIQKLMEENELSNRKLAEIIDVSHPTVGNYLKGKQIINSEKLLILANYFNVQFDYFFSKNHPKLDLLFRADKPSENMEGSLINKLKIKFENYIKVVNFEDVSFIPQTYNLNIKGNELTEKDEKKIEKIAIDIRRLLGIENTIPENYYSELEKIGIHVIATTFSNENLFGASSYSNKYGSFIFINSDENIPEERQLLSLFHELGHLLFNRSEYKESEFDSLYDYGRSDINEKIANKFAGYLLIPRELVNNYIESRSKKLDMFEMKHHFKVSIQALYMALNNYSIINDKQYRNFWKRVNSKGWKKREPSPLDKKSIEYKNSRLIESIKKLYFSDEISLNKVSEVLAINNLETRKMVKKWNDLDEQYEKI